MKSFICLIMYKMGYSSLHEWKLMRESAQCLLIQPTFFAYFVKLTFNAVYLKDRKFGVSFKRNRNDKVNQKSSNMLLKSGGFL